MVVYVDEKTTRKNICLFEGVDNDVDVNIKYISVEVALNDKINLE